MNLFFKHLKYGKLSFIGKPMFWIIVNLELLFERLIDQMYSSEFETPLITAELTAIIKTFERPKELKRLVQSIRRFYPHMKIIVVDDSREPTLLDGVNTIVMPFDSGISAGRNRALSDVTTKYILLLDDDFVFYRKTDFNAALKYIAEYEDIDIMGGTVVNLPLYKVNDYTKVRLYPVQMDRLKPLGSLVGSLPVYDKVANFYIARTIMNPINRTSKTSFLIPKMLI